jgi:hypothetical protein
MTVTSLVLTDKDGTEGTVVVEGSDTTTLLLVTPEVIMIFTSGHPSLALAVKLPFVVIKMFGQLDGLGDDWCEGCGVVT